jgi:SAM-dependent methyltransferase
MVTDGRRICDYEGSDYRSAFWEDADRDYEDTAERLVLSSLIPVTGSRLLEIGAGYGRLAPLYGGYESVYLLDYAHSMLTDARSRLGDQVTYVCGDLYHLPFCGSAFDTIVEVRVLHHVEDVPSALFEVHRVLRLGGTLVLEHANKRHLKARLREWRSGGPGETSLSSLSPHEFVPLNWSFHPDYVELCLGATGLTILRRRALSHFRSSTMKRLLPARGLARLDYSLSGPLSSLSLAPSKVLVATKLTGGPDRDDVWRCPVCRHEPLTAESDHVPCPSCSRQWPIRDGVHIFRANAT